MVLFSLFSFLPPVSQARTLEQVVAVLEETAKAANPPPSGTGKAPVTILDHRDPALFDISGMYSAAHTWTLINVQRQYYFFGRRRADIIKQCLPHDKARWSDKTTRRYLHRLLQTCGLP